MLIGCLEDGSRHLFIYIVSRNIGLRINGLYGEHSSFALYQWCLKSLADGSSIDGCRHDDDLQIWSDDFLCLSGEGKRQVGVDASLVKLIEDDSAHSFERGIMDEHPGKDSLGEYLDAGF